MSQTILHTLNQSPFASQIWQDCLEHIEPDDCLVLLNDGVYGALNHHPYRNVLHNKTCYAIKEDVETRGLNQLNLNPDIILISYEQWVELAVKHPLSQSWF